MLNREEEAEAPGVLTGVLLGGMGGICGRRSGRPDCKAGWKRRIKPFLQCCEGSDSHAGKCWKLSVNMTFSSAQLKQLRYFIQSLP